MYNNLYSYLIKDSFITVTTVKKCKCIYQENKILIGCNLLILSVLKYTNSNYPKLNLLYISFLDFDVVLSPTSKKGMSSLSPPLGKSSNF